MLDVYQKALDRAGEIIAGVKTSQFGNASPCDEFTAKDIMNHLIGGCYLFDAALRGESPDPNAPTPDLAGDDPVGAFEQARKLAFDAFSAPGSLEKTVNLPGLQNQPATFALGIALMEATVHGWDLAKATGQDATIDPAIAAVFLEQFKAQGIPEAFRNEKGDPFKSEVKVPDGASPGDKLVAYLGRTP